MSVKYVVALLAIVGCDAPESVEAPSPDLVDDVSEPGDQVDDTDSSSDDDAKACADANSADGVRFDGSVVYSDGTIGDFNNTRVSMCCEDGCQTAEWGDNGFCFTNGRLEEGVYSFKVMPLGGDNYATPLSFITVEDADILLEEPVLVPEFSHVTDLEDGVFDAGNGLKINVRTEGFTASQDYLAAVEVAPESAGLPLDGIESDKVLGIWYLGAFDAEIDPMWSFELEDSTLPVGAKVEILNGSYYDGEWLRTGTATVEDDGVLRVDLDSGISILSTLVLVEQ
jgi:hypothetical protein